MRLYLQQVACLCTKNERVRLWKEFNLWPMIVSPEQSKRHAFRNRRQGHFTACRAPGDSAVSLGQVPIGKAIRWLETCYGEVFCKRARQVFPPFRVQIFRHPWPYQIRSLPWWLLSENRSVAQGIIEAFFQGQK